MAILELNRFRYNLYSEKDRPPHRVASILQSASEAGGEPRQKVLDGPYPAGHKARNEYTTTSGKRLTPYQWKVYDYILTVPVGKVTTYKDVARAVGGSARAAGMALAKNPFAPYVPCHRVIASNLSIGGFCGQKHEKGTSASHPLIKNKRALLAAEGVIFDGNGHLCQRSRLLESN